MRFPSDQPAPSGGANISKDFREEDKRSAYLKGKGEIIHMAKINDNTLDLLRSRYFYKDPNTGEVLEKTPEELFRRVAKAVASNEEADKELWEDKFYKLMDEQRFMPNTPTLVGAGYEGKSLAACSVIGRVPDSLEGIYEKAYLGAKLTKMGYGIGLDLSDIRPKGAIIKSSGGASAGVTNWMRLFNTVADTTRQGDKSRRAAVMMGLRFNHPDIFDFITSKSKDGDLSSMNISVVITDEEMQAVKEDKEINLTWGGKVFETVKAREIFNALVDNMHSMAEPGILFYDTINKDNVFKLEDKMPEDHPHAMVISNPCQPLTALVLTDEGYKTFGELLEVDTFKVAIDGEYYDATKPFYTGDKEVYRVTLSTGQEIDMTANHRITAIVDGKRQDIELSNLSVGDSVLTQVNQVFDREIDYHSNVLKDGLTLFEIGDFIAGSLTTFDTDSVYSENNMIKASKQIKLGLLSGLFKTSTSFSSDNAKLLRDIQLILSEFGTASEISGNKLSITEEGAGEIISTITSIEPIGVMPVYDITVSQKHHYVTSNLVVHNCGEAPLEAGEVCQLGSISLPAHFNKGLNSIDYDKLETTVINAVRFLDNVIDVNSYPNEFFESKAKGNRKIGLGTAGLADYFVLKGIQYDSYEALDEIDEVYKFIFNTASTASLKLAQEKGNFLNYKDSTFARDDIPMRNANILSQAPTGSIANILNVSYGIEPYFAVVYKRRIVEGEFIEASPMFQKDLNNLVRDPLERSKILDACYKAGTTQIPEVPEGLRRIYRCANDISTEWHIKVQAQLQKYFDAAISKSINAPEDDSKDGLFDLLIRTWETGIKGCTYYRNNSRQNQTIQIGTKEEEVSEGVKLNTVTPIHRSDFDKTIGTTVRKNTACGQLYVTINKDDEGNIVETFVNTSKNGTCQSNIAGLNRMTSLALRGGVKVEEVVDQLRGIRCSACTVAKSKKCDIQGLSCPDIIANCIEQEYSFSRPTEKKEKPAPVEKEEDKNLCPNCGAEFERLEGCFICTCGYSKCS